MVKLVIQSFWQQWRATVYREAGSEAREAHQSLFQVQRRHLLDRQRRQRQPRHVCETLETRCSHVQVTVFDRRVVSSESVVHLDTERYKGPRWKTVRKLDSRTHIKPSSLGVPLSPLSSHPKWGTQLVATGGNPKVRKKIDTAQRVHQNQRPGHRET